MALDHTFPHWYKAIGQGTQMAPQVYYSTFLFFMIRNYIDIKDLYQVEFAGWLDGVPVYVRESTLWTWWKPRARWATLFLTMTMMMMVNMVIFFQSIDMKHALHTPRARWGK